MFRELFNLIDLRNEVLVCISLTVFYISYYLLEVVKKPLLICGDGEFRDLLQSQVETLREPFWPTPWCVEARLQTVLASLLRTRLLPPLTTTRQIVRLPDGGQVALDWVEEEGAGLTDGEAPVVVVVPGLTGGAHADYVRCVAAAARGLGARCAVFNNRGLGGLQLTTPKLYCALSHEDLAAALVAAEERAGGGPLLAVGVSLGGLILAHHLASRGETTRVRAALVLSSPLDVERAAECLARPVNAPLSWHMARCLRRTLRAHGALAGRWSAAETSRSVREFDAAFTAPHFGFASVEQYYREANLRDKLGQVRAPLLCVCAADDPFQPLAALPAREAGASARVALAVPWRGGHIGFLERWWPSSVARDHFLARLTRQYFAALLASPHLLHRPPPGPA
ncbi:unnamed protein product [Pieris brassicae]|uniref:AB hydrolase-1 domain-containing protein n=1 Tax=Pieris brassicae TaxID=7116 RepID=A0A9P0X4E9_PIEBR|nr:unnamed protein product [Pieris brassicae]